MEARPLSGFYHIGADFIYINTFLLVTKQSTKFQSDPSYNCFTIDGLVQFVTPLLIPYFVYPGA